MYKMDADILNKNARKRIRHEINAPWWKNQSERENVLVERI